MQLTPVKPFSESTFDYQNAQIILLGIPLDITVSFRPGTRFAPSAIRELSWHLEDYSYLTNENILDVPFFDIGDLFLSGNLENNIREIKSAIAEILNHKKIPLSIGGEHLITFPVVQAMNETYPDLHVIVFDAHTDLSDGYKKMQLSHSNVMRLIYDTIGNNKLFIFGTRTGTREDKQFFKNRIGSSYEQPSNELIEKLKDKPVYISIDVDVLDPSVAPGVTAPELMGWRYEELHGVLRRFTEFNKIVGVDITEISPHYDPSGITTLIGARIVRETMFLLNRTLKNAQ